MEAAAVRPTFPLHPDRGGKAAAASPVSTQTISQQFLSLEFSRLKYVVLQTSLFQTSAPDIKFISPDRNFHYNNAFLSILLDQPTGS